VVNFEGLRRNNYRLYPTRLRANIVKENREFANLEMNYTIIFLEKKRMVKSMNRFERVVILEE
jgi:hypothetical protein